MITGAELSEIINQSKWFIIIPIILIILLVVILLRHSKKNRYKKNEALKAEVRDYLSMFETPTTYTYSGAVSLGLNSLFYSRGHKIVEFDIKIERNTTLYLSDVDPWFEGRNYNEREAIKILNDIKQFLITNKHCKNVEIITEEQEEDVQQDFE